MITLTKEDLINAGDKFKDLEKRGTIYYNALSMVHDFEMESMILILATWNGKYFNNTKGGFDLNLFEKTVNECQPLFKELEDKNFKTVDFKEIETTIKKIYNSFSKIEGVKYTGASKIMHIKNPHLFVMWDSYMRKNLRSEYGFDIKKPYPNDAEGYVEFLKDMQKLVRNISWCNKEKTLAKAIDEYNYTKISVVEREKKKKQKKVENGNYRGRIKRY